MIEYISGQLAELTPTYAVIDVSGIGYLLNITLPTFTALQGHNKAKLLVHEAIREDAHVLFGFIDNRERSLFRELLAVSGVGASTARMILSSISAPELETVIAYGDHSRLKSVKGIGAKTAQRIIVDLKGKIKPQDDTLFIQPDTSASNATFDEALAALMMLGFNRQPAHKALRSIFQTDPTTTVEGAIKKALSML